MRCQLHLWMAGEERLVSWQGAQVNRSDLLLLEPGEWLNDHLITFYFEHLSRQEQYRGGDYVFVGAESTFWIGVEEDADDVRDALYSLGVFDAKYAFFPINDHDDRMTLGGTHWALLVRVHSQSSVDRNDCTWPCGVPLCVNGLSDSESEACGDSGIRWLYFDSAGTRNYSVALRIATKIEHATGKFHPVQVSVLPCAKQQNCYDCGMYVLLFTEMFARQQYIPHYLPDSRVCAARAELRELILSLKTQDP